MPRHSKPTQIIARGFDYNIYNDYIQQLYPPNMINMEILPATHGSALVQCQCSPKKRCTSAIRLLDAGHSWHLGEATAPTSNNKNMEQIRRYIEMWKKHGTYFTCFWR
jgi:hypothetical protein